MARNIGAPKKNRRYKVIWPHLRTVSSTFLLFYESIESLATAEFEQRGGYFQNLQTEPIDAYAVVGRGTPRVSSGSHPISTTLGPQRASRSKRMLLRQCCVVCAQHQLLVTKMATPTPTHHATRRRMHALCEAMFAFVRRFWSLCYLMVSVFADWL